MKFLKNNMFTLASLVVMFMFVMIGDAAAAGPTATVFQKAFQKLASLFRNAKTVLFVIGGFGLIALAFQAIFGKVKWPWFAALAFGLAVVAAAGAIVNYATDDSAVSGGTSDLSDSLGSL